MTRTLGILGLLVALTGLVFVGQGLGLIRGRSLMVDDIRWAWVGAALVLAGVGIWIRGRRVSR